MQLLHPTTIVHHLEIFLVEQLVIYPARDISNTLAAFVSVSVYSLYLSYPVK
jgi:hypothetical protein